MPVALAEDLGVVGPTYEIAEPDLLEVIESRLKRMEQTGELARKQREHRDRVVSAVENRSPSTVSRPQSPDAVSSSIRPGSSIGTSELPTGRSCSHAASGSILWITFPSGNAWSSSTAATAGKSSLLARRYRVPREAPSPFWSPVNPCV
jgi:hypothetical protein